MKISYEACKKGMSVVELFISAMIKAFNDVKSEQRKRMKHINQIHKETQMDVSKYQTSRISLQ